MSTHQSAQGLEEQNRQFKGTGGVSQENRRPSYKASGPLQRLRHILSIGFRLPALCLVLVAVRLAQSVHRFRVGCLVETVGS